MKTKMLLIVLSALATISPALGQTPASGGGAASGAATVGQDVKAMESPRAADKAAVSGGGAANEVPGMTPKSPTGAPVPNVAVSKPPADGAAPAGR